MNQEIGLWDINKEKEFFLKYLDIAEPEHLFYQLDDGTFVAYYPKGYKGKTTTLQSRNSFVGTYTEKWVKEILKPIAEEMDVFVLNSVVCEELGLTSKSPADVAICKTDEVNQIPENIIAIFEVKMSIVWNWKLTKNSNYHLELIGDYKTHKGNPGLLRSDSMLKAIGKSINIRISSIESARIPIIVLGNTPITESYYTKVDNLKRYGIIQGFWSLNPKPLDNEDENLKSTPKQGFLRFDTFIEFKNHIFEILDNEKEFFAGMKSKNELGRIIEIASREETYEKKAEKFLSLIRGAD